MNTIRIEETPDEIDVVALSREVSAACDRWLKSRGIYGDWVTQIAESHAMAKAKGKK